MSDTRKGLRYVDALNADEARIAAALPGLIDGLISRARAGDTRAAIYLCDRVMGRVGPPGPRADGPRIAIPDEDARERLRERLEQLGAGRGA